ncbi:hypothetical protein [Cellulomonas sp.]|uniref:hypothetical protein n=1 Tax=Cellulomonas sp. TaxID=40001 RepID=UPI002589005D|nr:hypothetical protein [Cellulomonas sp.]MCR6688900.1 hypothetical protein [Cellulomonas sp.]
MGHRRARFERSALDDAERAELARVDALADELEAHLAAEAQRIDLVHIHRAQSSAVQSIVAAVLRDHLGFREEVVLTPQDGFVTHARPDFVYSLGPGRGVIAEVERGGTTTNNHDLKDLWKTHIASDAQHLFLVVPNANWNEAGIARERPYGRVLTRLGAFFGDPRREIDVVSLHIFGYGRES